MKVSISIELWKVLASYLRAISSIEHRGLANVIVRACEDYVDTRSTNEYAKTLEGIAQPNRNQRAFLKHIREDLGR